MFSLAVSYLSSERIARNTVSRRALGRTTGTKRSVSSTPGLDVGCVPDRPRSQPCERLGEVIPLRVLESSALGHTKYLSGLSETCETKNPHPAQAYDRGRRDTPSVPLILSMA